MKITVTYDEALQLLARALSIKYDIKLAHFKSSTQILTHGGSNAAVQAIEFEFYGEFPPLVVPPAATIEREI